LVDYFLISPAPLPDIGVRFGDSEIGELFRVNRVHPFERGDKMAAQVMQILLEPFAEGRTDFDLDILGTQLEVEFAVGVSLA
jgi:hypothetical protein